MTNLLKSDCTSKGTNFVGAGMDFANKHPGAVMGALIVGPLLVGGLEQAVSHAAAQTTTSDAAITIKIPGADEFVIYDQAGRSPVDYTNNGDGTYTIHNYLSDGASGYTATNQNNVAQQLSFSDNFIRESGGCIVYDGRFGSCAETLPVLPTIGNQTAQHSTDGTSFVENMLINTGLVLLTYPLAIGYMKAKRYISDKVSGKILSLMDHGGQ